LNLKAKQFIDTFIGMPLVYINALMASILGFLCHRDHSLTNPPSTIIFIKLLGFGSILLASDSIYSIKRKYPNARIILICSSGILEGASSLNLFDDILVIDDTSFIHILRSSLNVLFKTWRLRNKWVADLEVYSKLTSILSLWTLAGNRFGFYFNSVAFRYKLNTHNVFFNTVVNVEENYKRMAGCMLADRLEEFHIPGFSQRNEQQKFQFIAINNTCSELAPERKLLPAQVMEICIWILEETPYHIALLGAPGDFETNEQLIRDMNRQEKIINTAGKYKFTNYFHFLYEQCKLIITIDSAPLHIANKLQIPNLSIWGPTTPESRIETNTLNQFVYLGVSCSPCAHVTDQLPCKGYNFCIRDIELKEIVSKLELLLRN